MNRTKLTILLITSAIIISMGGLGTLYFKYWHEPTASYTESSDPKLHQIRQDLKELKAELKSKGEYNCCIKNDCNWCAIYMEHCPCADLVVKDGQEKSCPECAAAWNRKQGKIPGVDQDVVQVTTFGIYGFEKGGHHHPDYSESNEEDHHHEKKQSNGHESHHH